MCRTTRQRGSEMKVRTNEALTDTEEVASRLGDMSLRILEVDEDTEAYDRGHVPTALKVHWKQDLQDPLRREFIGAEAFAALMDRLAIEKDTEVGLYGVQKHRYAPYTEWYV